MYRTENYAIEQIGNRFSEVYYPMGPARRGLPTGYVMIDFATAEKAITHVENRELMTEPPDFVKLERYYMMINSLMPIEDYLEFFKSLK